MRKWIYLPSDIVSYIGGTKKSLEPLKGDIFVGSGDFIGQGQIHLKVLRMYTQIRPESQVLDVGCGIGRTAVALTSFLSEYGSYEGFDVVKKGINWCKKKITSQYTNFNFQHIPLHNDLYTSYKKQATQFKFPYPHNSFDITFLFSVFTHMPLSEIENYLFEIERSLKPNGQCLATFFTYSKKQEEMIVAQKEFNFPISEGQIRIMDKKVKSANVAIPIELLKSLAANSKLDIISYIEGYWKDNVPKTADNDFQDIIVFQKRN